MVFFVDPAIEGQVQTNGIAEKLQDVTTQVREYNIAFETCLNQYIPARSVIFTGLVEHAADTINRHVSGHDSKVPLHRIKNRLPKAIDVEFGEQVLANVPTYFNKRRRSLQERAVPGTWLGF